MDAGLTGTWCSLVADVLQVCACLQLPDCACLVNQLKCTDMCKLQTCTNQRTEDEDEVAVELDDSDTDDEDN